jgi:hypothetical protein
MVRYPELCLVQMAIDRLQGLLLGRPGRGVVSAGPWYARELGTASPALLEALAESAASLLLGIGILETNRAAPELTQAAASLELPDPPTRMAKGLVGGWPSDPRLLSIGSPAKG